MELIPLLTLGNSVYCSHLQPTTLIGHWSQPSLQCSSTHPPSLLRFSLTSLRNARTEDISRSRYGSWFSVSINESPFLEPASRAPSVAFFSLSGITVSQVTWNAKYLRFTIPRDRLVALFLLLKQYSWNLRKTNYVKIWLWNQIFCTCLS